MLFKKYWCTDLARASHCPVWEPLFEALRLTSMTWGISYYQKALPPRVLPAKRPSRWLLSLHWLGSLTAGHCPSPNKQELEGTSLSSGFGGAGGCLVAKSRPTLLQPHGLWPARFLYSWDFPGKNTGVGCHFLRQGIFLARGSNPCLLRLLYWQADSLPLRLPRLGKGLGSPKGLVVSA